MDYSLDYRLEIWMAIVLANVWEILSDDQWVTV